MPYRNTKPALTDRERNGCIYTQQNFAILNDVWNINHQQINEGGLIGHKFLTFPPVAAPGTGATECALFARTGVYGALNPSELCFRRLSNGVINEFTSDQKSAEGWVQLPSGILIKWIFGKVVGAGAAGSQTHTWNNAANYPAFTAVYQSYVYLSAATGAGAVDIDATAYVNSSSNTQVNFVTWQRSENPVVSGVALAYRAHIVTIGKGPGV